MINIAIVEDDEKDLNIVQSYLLKYISLHNLDVNIKKYSTSNDFLNSKNINFNIVFLDIQLPDIDGISLAHTFRNSNPKAIIIFITSLSMLAIRGYEVNALDFIVKPLIYNDFAFKIRRAFKSISYEKTKEFHLRLPGNNYYNFLSSDLLYVEVIKHKLIYHLKGRDISTYDTLSSVIPRLISCGFLQCNRCYVVNPIHINKISGYDIFIGTDILRISQQRRKEFMESFTNWTILGNT